MLLTAEPNTISGALIVLILAIAAVVPTVVIYVYRLYKRKINQEHETQSRRLKIDEQTGTAKIELAKTKVELEHKERMAELKHQQRTERAIYGDPTMDAAKKAVGNTFKAAAAVLAAPTLVGAYAVGADPLHLEEEEKDSIDLELFRKKALRLGCTEDMSLTEMAETVIKYAPEASLRQLPESMPIEEKAARLLGAFTASGNKKEKEEREKQEQENKQKAFDQKLELEKKEAEHRMKLEEKRVKGQLSVAKKKISADVHKEAINATAQVVDDVGGKAVEAYI